jgi:hypothetical protein
MLNRRGEDTQHEYKIVGLVLFLLLLLALIIVVATQSKNMMLLVEKIQGVFS